MKRTTKVAMVLGLLVIGPRWAFSDPIQWQMPLGIGTIQLPFQSSELVGGYDFILHHAITGYSTPIATFWNEISGEVGAIAVPESSTIVQPYIAAGVDIKKHIPMLMALTSLHLNGFGRYDTGEGKAGAGLSASYQF